jgi:hypothetical protein
MNVCIYCRCELPRKVPPEHVIPQGFGVFTPDITLDCVCSSCNGYFGSKLEWPMRVESLEGMRRFQFGLGAGEVGSVGTRGVMPTVGEEGDWKGARVKLHKDKNGNSATGVLPQVGARRNSDDEIEWCLEKDLTEEWAAKYPKGSEFRIVGGEGPEDIKRVQEKLKKVCPTFVYKGELDRPYSGDGMVLIHAEHQNNRTVIRCFCKIAFNYMALICGEDFVLSSEFDDMRAFVRYDVGESTGRAFVKQKPIIAQEIISGERMTDGHVLGLEGRPKDRTIEAQVALFNSIPYRIPLGDYLGHPFARGHFFCVNTWESSELRTAYAGPNFDPNSIL